MADLPTDYRPMWIAGFLLLLAAGFILNVPRIDVHAAAPGENRKLKAADEALHKAAVDFKAGRFKQAGEAVKEAQKLIAELTDASGLQPQLDPILARIKRAHALLELEGVSLPPLELPVRPTLKKPGPMTKPNTRKASATAKSGDSADNISFVKHVAPVFVKHCFECHASGRQNGGQLSVESFTGLSRGGQSGVPIVPGKPAESLLVKKLRGTAGARMPLRREPLSESDIAMVEKWITEGAKFDSADATQSLDLVVATSRAKDATHEQLSAERAELAKKNWRLAVPDGQPATLQTANFLLIGNVGQETLASLGPVAEQQASIVAKMLRAGADQPLVKGRVTLFVFKRRADYSEWRMVEAREIPHGSRGHWKFAGLDAYACIVPPNNEGYSLAALIAEQIAGIHVASLGRVPTWFAQGSGRLIASRVDSRDARIRDWDNQYPAALSAAWKVDDFLAGNLPPKQQGLISFAVVKTLAANPQKYHGLLSMLRQGQDFDPAFARIYGQTAKEAIAAAVPRSSTWRPYARRDR